MWKSGHLAAVVAFVLALSAAPAHADVVKLEILSREPMNSGSIAFEIIRGRVHGELDPRDRHNRIIQDIDRAPKNGRGKVVYVATFALAKPLDLSKTPRVLLYQVVNRGNGDVAPNAEGDIVLVSGWQGDVMPTAANDDHGPDRHAGGRCEPRRPDELGHPH